MVTEIRARWWKMSGNISLMACLRPWIMSGQLRTKSLCIWSEDGLVGGGELEDEDIEAAEAG